MGPADPALTAMAAAVAALRPEPQMNALRFLRRLAQNPPPDSLIGREKLAFAMASFPPDEASAIAEATGQALEAGAVATGFDRDMARVAALVSIETIAELAAGYSRAMVERSGAGRH